MSRQNKGIARRIFEGSDATLQLQVRASWDQSKKLDLQPWNDFASTCLCQGFYDEVSSPLLLDVDLRYPDNVVDSLTTNHFNQLFNGSEIVVAGRMMDNDLSNFLVEVHGQGVRRVKLMKCLFCLVNGSETLFTGASFCHRRRTTSMCRAWALLWTGVWFTQMTNTSLGLSSSVCGPTSPSSSYWTKGQFLIGRLDWIRFLSILKFKDTNSGFLLCFSEF